MLRGCTAVSECMVCAGDEDLNRAASCLPPVWSFVVRGLDIRRRSDCSTFAVTSKQSHRGIFIGIGPIRAREVE